MSGLSSLLQVETGHVGVPWSRPGRKAAHPPPDERAAVNARAAAHGRRARKLPIPAGVRLCAQVPRVAGGRAGGAMGVGCWAGGDGGRGADDDSRLVALLRCTYLFFALCGSGNRETARRHHHHHLHLHLLTFVPGRVITLNKNTFGGPAHQPPRPGGLVVLRG